MAFFDARKAVLTAAALGIEEFVKQVACGDDRGGWRAIAEKRLGSSGLSQRWAKGAGNTASLATTVHIDSEHDVYYSLNTFTCCRRVSDRAFALCSIGIDIDIDTSRASTSLLLAAAKAEILQILDRFFSRHPELLPTAIVDSGHGWQLIWTLERSIPCGTHAMAKSPERGVALYRNVWEDLAAALAAVVDGHGFAHVDRSVVGDLSRLFRLPGTINEDMPARVERYTGQRAQLSVLRRALDAAGLRKAKNKTVRGIEQKVYRSGSFFLLGRIRDLQDYVRLNRDATHHHRNNLCHLYINALRGVYGLQGTDMQWRMLCEFNQMFDNPLSESELEGVVRSADRVLESTGEPYKYKIETLAAKLDITEREAAKWFGSTTRKEQERAKRRQARQNRDAEIIARVQAGERQADIAKELGCSAATVSRVARGRVAASRIRAEKVAEAHRLAAQGLSQKEIAATLGCAQATVSGYIRTSIENCISAPVPVVHEVGGLSHDGFMVAGGFVVGAAVSATANSCQLSFEDLLDGVATTFDSERMEAFCNSIKPVVCNTVPLQVGET